MDGWEVWLIVAVLLGVAEMFSLDLVLAMLALGAVVGAVVSLAGAPFALAAVVAAIAAAGCLTLLRPPLVSRLHSGPDLSQGHNKLIGTRGVVMSQITGTQVGQVKLGGEVWTAAPYDEGIVITPGETVEVLQIKGATAMVHPVPSLGPGPGTAG